MAFILAARFVAGAHVGPLAGYYSGRAGSMGSAFSWVDERQSEAFRYAGQGEAEHKAELFNRNSGLHGLQFSVHNIGEA